MISLADDWDRALSECVKAVKAGKLIVYPTDTVYGIGGNALDPKAVEKICRAKRKETTMFSVIVANLEMLNSYFNVSEAEISAIMASLPGPFTFILEPKDRSKWLVGGGVRIPNHVFMRQVCHESNVPIITTSANLHGQPAPVRFSDIPKEILDAAEVAVDGGETMHKGPSTIVSLRDKKIERQGVADFTF